MGTQKDNRGYWKTRKDILIIKQLIQPDSFRIDIKQNDLFVLRYAVFLLEVNLLLANKNALRLE